MPTYKIIRRKDELHDNDETDESRIGAKTKAGVNIWLVHEITKQEKTQQQMTLKEDYINTHSLVSMWYLHDCN